MKDQVILITGATGGIGHVLSKGFAALGATVILLGRNIKALEGLYDEIENNGYPKPAIVPLDLATATPDDYQKLHDTIEKEFGRLDGLIHTAATLGSLTPIEHYPVDQWVRVLQVNLNSAFLLTQAALPLLKKSPAATVIFTSCDEGRERAKGGIGNSKAYWGAYSVSKCAIEGFAQILAEECQTHTHIRVCTINPGKVRTKLRQSAYPAESGEGLVEAEEVLRHYVALMNTSVNY